MPTSAPGSPEPRRHAAGFTLLELLVVVTLVALASVGVGFSLRDGPDRGLEREAQRLSALLTAGHAQARLQGIPLTWRAGDQGFEFDGRFHPWLTPGTRAQPAEVVLGPEPLMSPTRLALSHGLQTTWLATDGLRPFTVGPDAAP